MTTKRATDAFPKSTLEDAILKAQKAGVDVTKVIKNSLQDALGKKSKKKIEGITGAETLLEEMNALINAAVTEEENVINNIDQIVNGLFEKLEKYPELFQRLLEDLKYDRLKSNLESAKVTTIPANLCEL